MFSSVYSSLLDLFGLLTIGAIGWALWRRYVSKAERLDRGFEPAIILLMVLMLMGTHFAGETLRKSIVPHGHAGFISSIFANTFAGFNESSRKNLWFILWWVHLLVLLSFLVYIPYSKHLHIFASLFNVFFKSLRPKGALTPIDIETTQTLGVEKIEEFTWKHLLDLYSCTECGRCSANCPATLSGKALSPQKVIKDLRHHLLELKESDRQQVSPLMGKRISEQEIWDCLTCYACQEVCPVSIEHLHKIYELRRYLVLVKNKIPESAERALRTLMMRGDPWTGTPFLRTDWMEGLPMKVFSKGDHAEILYWVGCAGALDERNRKVSLKLANLMREARVDFGILGAEESCCGDPGRRLGQELVFQNHALKNIEILKRYQIKRIVTYCPRCYNTLKNEYPQFGGEFEVIHYTELIADLLRRRILRPQAKIDKRVTYHDPCYLGRYNGGYQAPRAIASAMPGLRYVELERNRDRSFCCGGGGGHLWLEERIGKRINVMRTEEVMRTGAEILVTACPYCLQMFEEGIKKARIEKSVKAMDICELFQQVS